MPKVMEVNIPVRLDFSQVSDGWHTFAELYEHRHMLYLFICGERYHECWRSRKKSDGTEDDGWFILGWESEFGQVSYHLPDEYWGLCERLRIAEMSVSPWDGHNSQDVISRLYGNVTEMIGE